ncbi:hypothetical protein AB3S75_019762 [Citrus x aurantiifolia]
MVLKCCRGKAWPAMASAYERFFLCMKNPIYCQYPFPVDC